MNSRRRAAMWRKRMSLVLKDVRARIRRSDAVCKQQWAVRSVTDYRADIKETKRKGVKVPKDHPFYRFMRGDFTEYDSPFYRFIRSVATTGSQEEKEELWRIFGIH